VDAAEVGHDFTRLEAILLVDRQVPRQLVLGRPDYRWADPELRGVEVELPAGARLPVRDREGRACGPRAGEGARGDRVVDRVPVRVREPDVAPELHAGHAGHRDRAQVTGRVEEVRDAHVVGGLALGRVPGAGRAAVVAVLLEVAVGLDALVAQLRHPGLQAARTAAFRGVLRRRERVDAPGRRLAVVVGRDERHGYAHVLVARGDLGVVGGVAAQDVAGLDVHAPARRAGDPHGEVPRGGRPARLARVLVVPVRGD